MQLNFVIAFRAFRNEFIKSFRGKLVRKVIIHFNYIVVDCAFSLSMGDFFVRQGSSQNCINHHKITSIIQRQ